MRTNEAPWDRIVRFVLGLAALVTASAALEPGALAVLLATVGSILIVTALVGWCPLYGLFRVRSHRVPPPEG